METMANCSQSTDGQDGELSLDYRGATGAFIYLATSFRPDIAYSADYLSRFMTNPRKKHCGDVKRTLRNMSTNNLRVVKSPDCTGAKAIVLQVTHA